MLAEVKAADAIGLDLSKASEYNNEIIKVVLSIYFAVLKRQSNEGVSGNADIGSPLLRSVFLGLPQFTAALAFAWRPLPWPSVRAAGAAKGGAAVMMSSYTINYFG